MNKQYEKDLAYCLNGSVSFCGIGYAIFELFDRNDVHNKHWDKFSDICFNIDGCDSSQFNHNIINKESNCLKN